MLLIAVASAVAILASAAASYQSGAIVDKELAKLNPDIRLAKLHKNLRWNSREVTT